MNFDKWLKKAEKDLHEIVNKEHHNLEIFNSNKHKNMLLPYYLQYQMLKKTWSLTLATWILAIATIVLILIKF